MRWRRIGVMRGEPVEAQHIVDFAYYLHIDHHFDEALLLIEGVLATQPDHEDALVWRRHVLAHLAA